MNMIDKVHEYFKSIDWNFETAEQPPHYIFRLGVNGNNGKLDIIVDVRQEEGVLMAYAMCPVVTPEAKLAAMAETLGRINQKLILGNFDLDFDNGNARYKVPLRFTDEMDLPAEFVGMHIITAVQMMDKYLPALMAVIYGNGVPAQIVEQIENDPKSLN